MSLADDEVRPGLRRMHDAVTGTGIISSFTVIVGGGELAVASR